MKLKKVLEGKIEFQIPQEDKYEASVFYNTDGIILRDLTISAIQSFQKNFGRKLTVCDAMAGTGIRGLRIAKEVKNVKNVVLVDKNPIAVKLIRKNIKANKLSKKCDVIKGDTILVMRENVFDVIDLDPFGSPNIFMESAAKSIFYKGLLSVTATDQAPLCGTYPLKCLKKYGIKSIETEFYNELGVRILLSFIILSLSRYEKAFIPLVSLASKHYYRVIGKIGNLSELTKLIQNFGYLNYCPICGYRSTGKLETSHLLGKENHKMINCGLIYLGEINDYKFCKDVLSDLKKRQFKEVKSEEKLMKTLVEESKMPPFYYDLHFIAKRFKIVLPKVEVFIKKLKSKGFKVSKTHFSPTSIKTDANIESIVSTLR